MKTLNLTEETIIRTMKSLVSSEGFKLLQQMWLLVRTGIIEEGKKRGGELNWSELKGFDKAVMLPEKWANKNPKQTEAIDTEDE